MAMKTYTAEQKAATLAKVEEIGITKAAKELSISPTTLNSWKKAAGEAAPVKEEAVPAEKTEPEKTEETPVKAAAKTAKKAIKNAKTSVKKGAKKLTEKATEVKKAAAKKAEDIKQSAEKKDVPAKAGLLTPAKQEKLIADNATLKAEIAELKAENVRLKKAISELTK